MFTPRISSAIEMSQLPSQSPTHGVGGGGVSVGVSAGVVAWLDRVAVAVDRDVTVLVALLTDVGVTERVAVAVAPTVCVAVGEGATHWSASSSQMPTTGHGLPLLVHDPVWHVSLPVQNRKSSVHGAPFGLKPSGGQVGLFPSQLSATSHSLGVGRHNVPDGLGSCVQVPDAS